MKGKDEERKKEKQHARREEKSLRGSHEDPNKRHEEKEKREERRKRERREREREREVSFVHFGCFVADSRPTAADELMEAISHSLPSLNVLSLT